MKSAMCRHCGKKRGSRNYGLCFQCYYIPEVKKLYVAPKEAPLTPEEIAERARRVREATIAKNLRGGEPHLTHEELAEVLP